MQRTHMIEIKMNNTIVVLTLLEKQWLFSSVRFDELTITIVESDGIRINLVKVKCLIAFARNILKKAEFTSSLEH